MSKDIKISDIPKPKENYSPKTQIKKNLDRVVIPQQPDHFKLNFGDKWNVFKSKISKGIDFIKKVVLIPSQIKSVLMWVTILIGLVIILKLFI